MRNLISILIIVLLIGWLVGYFGFGEAVGSLIHILLVLAVIGILYRLATGKRL
ncbi:MAG: lmo0937 family membrane protein [Flavobacteriia bacterium]|nr:lmo0937 family membrane protein [Flavobacteriia bacterium]